ncbi:hypothetical protein N658DRAFT_48745 [Parathielavia hyrcaniae]|uniref:Uncharacterized protein n=1 Tax=Parathielavia hyrcaniae TaxID=113614 RepID=A0AAN6T1F8_9PEZI|nr:hypothetical protein N658DRAFT_48745 [Parathielavia hyrcaniae]
MNVEKRKAMLEAGELDPQAAERELKMHRQARKRYSEDKREEKRGLVPRRHIVSLPPYFPPRSDEDLYLIYCAERGKEWAKSMVENKTEYRFAVYRTKQIRAAHETVPAELQRDVVRFLNEDHLKRALGNVLHMYRVQDPNLGNSFNKPPELLYGTVPVTFDMFWTRYLHSMMLRATADDLAGKASPGVKSRLHDSELAKQVRHVPSRG